jgi:hypothetical protein
MLIRGTSAVVAVCLAIASLVSLVAHAQVDDKATWPVIVNPFDPNASENATALDCRDNKDTRDQYEACLANAGIDQVLTSDEADAARAQALSRQPSLEAPTAPALADPLPIQPHVPPAVPTPRQMPTSAPIQQVSSAGLAAGRLSSCLQRNEPAPDPGPWVNWPTYDQAFRQDLEIRTFVGGLLLSAGMYGNQPMDIRDAYRLISRQGFPNGGPQALANLTNAFDKAHSLSDADLSANCGLTVIRRMLRAQPAGAGVFVIGIGTSGGGWGRNYLLSVVQSVVEHYKNDPSSFSPYPEDLLKSMAKAVGLIK